MNRSPRPLSRAFASVIASALAGALAVATLSAVPSEPAAALSATAVTTTTTTATTATTAAAATSSVTQAGAKVNSSNLRRLNGTTQLTRGCVNNRTRVVSHRKAGESCGRRSTAVTFTSTAAVRLCLLPGGTVKRSRTDAACKAADGFRTHGLGNHTNLYCAVPGRQLTWRPAPKKCVGKEKAYNLRNVPPADLTLDGGAVAENRPVGTTVGRLRAVDTDRHDSHSFRLVPGAGDDSNHLFAVTGDRLVTRRALDHETQASHRIRVVVSDARNRRHFKNLTLRVTDVAEAPRDLTLTGTTVEENRPAGAVVGTLRATDPDRRDVLTHRLVAGPGDADNALFTIVGTQLRAASTLDHEAAATRTVRVRTTDSTGLRVERAFTIGVTDVNDAPTGLGLRIDEVAENRPAGTVVSPFAVADEDPKLPWTFALEDADDALDNALFRIDGDQLVLATALDHETARRHTLRVTVTDAEGMTFTQVLTVHVSDVPEAPTALTLSADEVAENVARGTVVGTLNGVDPDAGDTLRFSLVAGHGDADNALFVIDAGRLVTAGALDHEASATRTVRLRATDSAGLVLERAVTITVADVNEAPHAITLDATTVAENEDAGTVVGEFTASDVDARDTHTFTLVPGAGDDDNAFFDVVDGELVTRVALDHEQEPIRSVRVEARDSGALAFETSFTIDVTDVNEAPADVRLTGDQVDENRPAGSRVGVLSASDVDGDDLTFTLVGGAGSSDNALFAVVDDELVTAVALDHEESATRTVRIRVEDEDGLEAEAAFAIGVADVNERPGAPALDGDVVAENSARGTVVGDLSALDPDAGDVSTFALVSGAGDGDNALFDVVDGALVVKGALDHEAAATRTVRVMATDRGGLDSPQRQLTITVTDVDEAPRGLTIDDDSVPENATGALVGALGATDPEGRPLTWTVTGGADRALFTVVGNELRTVGALDHEAQAERTVSVSVTDGVHAVALTVVVRVLDRNDAPSAPVLRGERVSENAAGARVGEFAATDQDGDELTFALVPGDVPDDNAEFEIVGAELRTRGGLDFEAGTTRTVNVAVSDDTTSASRSFQVFVTDVDEAPHSFTLSADVIDENDTAPVGDLSAVDPEGQNLTFAFAPAPGTDNSLFTLDGATLRPNGARNHEVSATYSVRLAVSDGTHLVAKTFTITVRDRNDAPALIMLSPAKIRRDSPVGSVVGTLSAVDQDAAPQHAFSVLSTSGTQATAELFEVDGTQLKVAKPLGTVALGDLTLALRVDDPWAADPAQDTSLEDEVTVTVLPARQIELADAGVDENEAVGTAAGTLRYLDGLGHGTTSFALVAGAADNAEFTIDADGTTLRTARVFDHENTATRTVEVRATQNGAVFVQEIVVGVRDVNEDPVAGASTLPTELAEGTAVGTVLGTLNYTDPEGEPLVFSRLSGDEYFDVSATGEVSLAKSPDFEALTGPSGKVLRFGVEISDGLRSVDAHPAMTVLDINDAPGPIVLSGGTAAEHAAVGTVVGTLSATDEDAVTGHVFSDVSVAGTHGAAGLFEVDGDSVKVKSSLRDVPAGEYALRVRLADTAHGTTQTRTDVVNISVTRLGLTLDNDTVAENSTGRVGQFTVQGGNGPYTFALPPGAADNDDFSVTAAGVLSVTRSGGLDHESAGAASVRGERTVRLQVTDVDGATVQRTVTVRVTDVNEAPTAGWGSILSEISENTPVGTELGRVSASDPDGDEITYALGGGDVASYFSISDTGVVTLAKTFDYENATHATQAGGALKFAALVWVRDGELSMPLPLVVTLVDVNETPTAITPAQASVSAHAADNTVVASLDVVDPDAGGTRTWAFAEDGNPGGLFALDAGRLVVAKDLSGLTGGRTVRLTVTDTWAGTTLTYSQDVRVEFTTLAGTLGPAAFTLVEETAGLVAVLTFTGGSGNPRFELVPGALDNDDFAISSDHLTAREGVAVGETPQVRIRVIDSSGQRWTFDRTITITDRPDAPTDITLSATAIDENAAPNTVVGTFGTVDADAGDSHAYGLVSGPGSADNAGFTISGNTLKANDPFDHETRPTLSIRVRSTDSAALWVEKSFTITVTNVNEAPHGLTLTGTSVMEKGKGGSVVGALSVGDPDRGDTVTYTVTGGPFAVIGSQLRTTQDLDHAAQSSWDVTVRATDTGSLWTETTFTVQVVKWEPAPIAEPDRVHGAVSNREVVVDVLGNDTDPVGGQLTVALVADANQRASVRDNKIVLRARNVKDQDVSGTYSVTSSVTGKTSTAEFTVEYGNRQVWHVDAAASAGGDGTQWAPYQRTTTLAGTGAENPSAEGDEIVLGAGVYGPVSLRSRQTIYGIGATVPDVRDASSDTYTYLDADSSRPALSVNGFTSVRGLRLRGSYNRAALGGAVTAGTATIAANTRITGLAGGAIVMGGVSAGAVLEVLGDVEHTAVGGTFVDLRSLYGEVSFANRLASHSVTNTPAQALVAVGGTPGKVTLAGGANLASRGTTLTATGVALEVRGSSSTLYAVDPSGKAAALSDVELAGATFTSAVGGGGLTLSDVTGDPFVVVGRAGPTTGGSLGPVSVRNSPSGIDLSFVTIQGAGTGGESLVNASNSGRIRLASSTVIAPTVAGGGSDAIRVETSSTAGGLVLDDVTVSDAQDSAVVVVATAAKPRIEVTNSRLIGAAAPTGSARDGLRVVSRSGAVPTVVVTNNEIEGHLGDAIQVAVSETAAASVQITQNTVSGPGQGVVVAASGTSSVVTTATVESNTIDATATSGITLSTSGLNRRADARVSGNTIGANACTGAGIVIDAETDSVLVAELLSNTVSGCASPLVTRAAQGGTADVTARGNTFVHPVGGASSISSEGSRPGGGVDPSTGLCLDVSTVDGGSLGSLNYSFGPGHLKLPGFVPSASATALTDHLTARGWTVKGVAVPVAPSWAPTAGACLLPTF